MRGQFGLTTLIIFIALIATAAIAAGVILYTTGTLQQRALRVGAKSRERVSTGIEVVQIHGYQFDPSTNTLNDKLNKVTGMGTIMVLMPGSAPVSFNDLVLLLTDEQDLYSINFKPVIVPKVARIHFEGADVEWTSPTYVMENQTICPRGFVKDPTDNTCVTISKITQDYIMFGGTNITIGSSAFVIFGGKNITVYYDEYVENMEIPTVLVTKLISNKRYVSGFLTYDGIVDARTYGFYWDPSDGYTEEELLNEIKRVTTTLKKGGADIVTGMALVGYQIKDEDPFLEEGEIYEAMILLPFAIEGSGNYLSPGEEFEMRIIPKEGHITPIDSKVPEVLPYGRVIIYPR